MVHNWTMQLRGCSSISTNCDIQTHRTTYGLGNRYLSHGLPNFQMKHGDSEILNLTYRCCKLNGEFVKGIQINPDLT